MKKLGPEGGARRETPGQRRLRVLNLRQQVKDGTYQPDLNAVAQRLIEEALAWLLSTRR